MSPRTKLVKAFAQGLGLPESAQIEGLQYRAVPQWNSMAHMQLVLEVENAFDIMLDSQQVLDLSSFEKAVEIVGTHGIDATA